jgi:NADH-quinone oxidoreductase subunit G
MEAALRTSYYLLTGANPPRIDFQATRGLDGVKEGSTVIDGHEVRFAVAHGLGNVETVLNRVRAARDAGEPPAYHFIEVMACPGGCVGGGGQPYGVTDGLRAKRAAGLYQDDQAGLWRCAHENPYVQKLYDDFLGEPLGEKSEALLHTSYRSRPTYRR